ncbi:MAG: bifunctional DNA-formamidopyrimidine glycosylase/DNA-(apurinic or apyrimidinic site) lyase [Caldilineaceae bacterium]|nr:bifunctional DNA-formamidopyrimidine glycosylase/DNA-(apurinic or apyrimidinic site) lyase [Caldilineaceae bacterium]
MPELPEVETYVRELTPALHGRQVMDAHVLWPRTIAAPTPEAFVQRISGARFIAFERRGKYMVLGLDQGDTLIVHLRMTGHLHVHPASMAPDKHTHVVMSLDDGRRLDFQDSRKFGRLWLTRDPGLVLAHLGPEPLDAHFSMAEWQAKLAGRRAAIKALLLDQAIIAGVGNIYADEALFLAGLHPTQRGGELTLPQLAALHASIQAVLLAAIEKGGSSLGNSSLQNHVRPTGAPGNYQEAHRVYQRTGQPCPRCGYPIERMVIAQRSTHFCPQCQRLG